MRRAVQWIALLTWLSGASAWGQSALGHPLGGLERLPFQESPLVVGWKHVDQAKHSEHPLEVQALGGIASDGKQLWFKPENEQAWVELHFALDKPVSGQLWGKMIHSWDYGTYRVRLDGQELATMDLHDTNVTPESHRWGTRPLAAGDHVLRFECVGKNKESRGYFLGFDALMVRVPSYSRAPDVDLRSLQAPRRP